MMFSVSPSLKTLLLGVLAHVGKGKHRDGGLVRQRGRPSSPWSRLDLRCTPIEVPNCHTNDHYENCCCAG